MASDMFHQDGCVRANIVTHDYEVTTIGKCVHTKVIGAVIIITAESIEAAESYMRNHWIRIPQQMLLMIRHDDSHCTTCTGGNVAPRISKQFVTV